MNGKAALITGAARGIGKAIAASFVAEGCEVYLTDIDEAEVKAAAEDLGWQIRCNAICPTAVLTDIWEPMLGDGPDREEKMAALVADTPLKRFSMPEEVAAMAVTLVSDEASYITGIEITMDGGLLAGSAAAPG